MHRRNVFLTLFALLVIAITSTGCRAIPQQQGDVTVTVVADGATQVMIVSDELIVSDVLRRAGVAVGELDRVNPPGHSRAADGMTITVVRVAEETISTQEIIPFRSRTVPNEGLASGETRLLQAGVNGVAEIVYRITYENGIEIGRNEVRRVLLTPPQDEVVMIGSQGELPTVSVSGTLAYISAGNAWIIRQNSANRRPLTLDGGLDGKVFELSSDGRQMLFTRTFGEASAEGSGLATAATRSPDDPPDLAEPFNTLWVILDTTDADSQPIRLDLQNILFATWVPGTERTIVYSTAEPRTGFPGWQANNDLWRAQISANGGIVQRRQLLEPSSGGIYGWYGTTFAFAPDGVTLAWAQPDAVGVLLPVYGEGGEADEAPTEPPDDEPAPAVADIPPSLLPDAYSRRTLVSFAPWNAYDFIWVPSPNWSPDGELIAVTTHGAPLGSEPPEDSPVFSLVVLPMSGEYSVTLVEQAGMWAEPRYSPGSTPDGEPLDAQLAYFQSLQPLDSVYGRYRLVIMDRDGSSPRSVFPDGDLPGLLPQPHSWSPDGRQIALVSPGPEGSLLLVDIATGLAQQVTADGQSSAPRWAP